MVIRVSCWLLVILACVAPAQEPAPQSVGEQFRAVKAEFDAAMSKFRKRYEAAKTEAERKELFASYPQRAKFVKRCKAFLKGREAEPDAVECISWVVGGERNPARRDSLLEALLTHHLESKHLGEVAGGLAYAMGDVPEKFLNTVLEKSPHTAVKGAACYALASMEQRSAKLIAGPAAERLDLMKERYGAAFVSKRQALGRKKLMARSEALLERVVKEFADVPSFRGTLGTRAESALFEIRNLGIGKVAPDIVGEDIDGNAMKLSDYRGKVVMLDFWGHW